MLRDRPPKAEAWVHEPKWDGYRAQIIKDGSDVRLYSKQGIEWSKKLPSTVTSLADLPARSAIIDCELCYAGPDGRPDFRALMRQMRSSRPDPFHLVFYCFDLMHLNGKDLRPLPLSERRRRLVELGSKAGGNPHLFVIDQFDDGDDLMQWCEKYRLEGVVSKRRGSPYVSGECRHWVKSKCAEWKHTNKDRGELFGQQPR